MELPAFEAIELAGAYSVNALFITGSVLSSPFGLLADLGTYLTSFLP